MSDQDQRLDDGQEDVSTPPTSGETLDLSLDNTLSIRQAAASAGVTEKTIRRWIQAGRLRAVKLGGQYQVAPADLATAQEDRPPPRDVPTHDARRVIGLDTEHTDPTPRVDVDHVHPGPGVDIGLDVGHIAPAVDLRPLVDHIAALEGQVRQLTEAATVWQVRAVQAEERLQALTAGDDSHGAGAVAAQEPHHAAETTEPTADASTPWWKFWERWG
ncbi:MAG: helix-turn-helix domain-containing protein [Chloroflexota bacterium]|nr:helix-turn-helix domain-containing protein [Chloroflexota bacterium]